MTYIKIIVFFVSMVSCSLGQEKGTEDVERELNIQKLNLHQSFLGFLSQKTIDGDKISCKYLLPKNSANKIDGVVLDFSKVDGALLSVKPLLGSAADKSEQIIIWAFDRFQNNQIRFDSLWEIVKACIGQQIDDKHIFMLLANGLSTYDGNDAVQIYEKGPVIAAVSKLKKDEFVVNGRLMLISMLKALLSE